jgi:hypothetical protein
MRGSTKIAVLVFGATAAAAALRAADRIDRTVDPNRTILLTGQVHPLASTGNDRGLADPGLDLSYVTLMLRPDPSLETFLAPLWSQPERYRQDYGVARLTRPAG